METVFCKNNTDSVIGQCCINSVYYMKLKMAAGGSYSTFIPHMTTFHL